MKKIMEKMQEYLANRKENSDNKGFSLVELIIVIAIMAILVGIVGTQVLPYINRSRVAKDREVLSSYCTAAVSAYSMNAESVTSSTTLAVDVFSPAAGEATTISTTIKELVGQPTATAFSATSLSSTDGKNATGVRIDYNFTNHTCTATFYNSSGDISSIEPVVSTL